MVPVFDAPQSEAGELERSGLILGLVDESRWVLVGGTTVPARATTSGIGKKLRQIFTASKDRLVDDLGSLLDGWSCRFCRGPRAFANGHLDRDLSACEEISNVEECGFAANSSWRNGGLSSDGRFFGDDLPNGSV